MSLQGKDIGIIELQSNLQDFHLHIWIRGVSRQITDKYKEIFVFFLMNLDLYLIIVIHMP